MDILRKNTRFIIIVLGLALMILLVRDFNSRMAELRRLKAEKEHVSAQVTSLVETKTALEAQLEYAKSDDAVRAWAYEEGKMAQPGDTVIRPVPAEGEAEAAEPTSRPEPAIVQNWELWLAMFVE